MTKRKKPYYRACETEFMPPGFPPVAMLANPGGAFLETRMIFFTGDTRSRKLVKILQENRIGRTVIDNAIRPYPGERWIFDNGAYRDYKAGREFDHDAYMRRVDMAQRIGEPYFAVLPDVVGDGKRTLDLSFSYLGKLPRAWHLYLVLQNGMTYEDVMEFQCASYLRLSGLFLGGDDKFKMTASSWSRFAHSELLLKFHYGRCGTWWKIQHAREVNADSWDSALPLWIRRRFKDCLRYLTNDAPQMEMWQFYEVDRQKGGKYGTQATPGYLSESQVSRLLDAAEGTYIYPILVTALHTGMRRAELFNLQWPDVDFTQGTITIQGKADWHTKNYKARTMQMTPVLESTLIGLWRRDRKCEYVFHNNGRRRSYVDGTLRSVCRVAGLEGVTLHTLRHTFASHLVLAGVTLREVQELMGHQSYETTLRYAHLSEGHVKKQVMRLKYAGEKESKPLRVLEPMAKEA